MLNRDFRGYKMVIDDLNEYSRYEHDEKIEFLMPAMIADYRQITRERQYFKSLYDNYLKTKPSSNREANSDRKVTSIRFVIESLNHAIKRFLLLAQRIKDCTITFIVWFSAP